MVLQKVVEEGQLEVTDTLIDDNNSSIQVGHSGAEKIPKNSQNSPNSRISHHSFEWIPPVGMGDMGFPNLILIPLTPRSEKWECPWSLDWKILGILGWGKNRDGSGLIQEWTWDGELGMESWNSSLDWVGKGKKIPSHPNLDTSHCPRILSNLSLEKFQGLLWEFQEFLPNIPSLHSGRKWNWMSLKILFNPNHSMNPLSGIFMEVWDVKGRKKGKKGGK
ncbi:hypothetical protein HGM15179_020369 [Zosterops borbonicus]|uniref:Uncharacterized protein n=1 Tax=Zosterops borbonicus TaxID=364589 RepID=A0A8K1D838_9PASS|nr:hypothetical protein HGM15179_020369 [Zosterops borbonicus]